MTQDHEAVVAASADTLNRVARTIEDLSRQISASRAAIARTRVLLREAKIQDKTVTGVTGVRS